MANLKGFLKVLSLSTAIMWGFNSFAMQPKWTTPKDEIEILDFILDDVKSGNFNLWAIYDDIIKRLQESSYLTDIGMAETKAAYDKAKKAGVSKEKLPLVRSYAKDLEDRIKKYDDLKNDDQKGKLIKLISDLKAKLAKAKIVAKVPKGLPGELEHIITEKRAKLAQATKPVALPKELPKRVQALPTRPKKVEQPIGVAQPKERLTSKYFAEKAEEFSKKFPRELFQYLSAKKEDFEQALPIAANFLADLKAANIEELAKKQGKTAEYTKLINLYQGYTPRLEEGSRIANPKDLFLIYHFYNDVAVPLAKLAQNVLEAQEKEQVAPAETAKPEAKEKSEKVDPITYFSNMIEELNKMKEQIEGKSQITQEDRTTAHQYYRKLKSVTESPQIGFAIMNYETAMKRKGKHILAERSISMFLESDNINDIKQATRENLIGIYGSLINLAELGKATAEWTGVKQPAVKPTVKPAEKPEETERPTEPIEETPQQILENKLLKELQAIIYYLSAVQNAYPLSYNPEFLKDFPGKLKEAQTIIFKANLQLNQIQSDFIKSQIRSKFEYEIRDLNKLTTWYNENKPK